MDHTDNCSGDAAAYVLNALTTEESARFEQHLSGCAVCQDEVDSLQGLTTSLAASVPQHRTPRRVKRRLMTAVHNDIQARQVTERRPMRRSLMAGLATAAVAVAALVLVQAGTFSGGAHLYGAFLGNARVSVTDSSASLTVHDLQHLSQKQVYEVWLKHGDAAPEPTNALFNVRSNGSGHVIVHGDLKQTDELLVTREPAGGSAVPTTAPVIAARIN